MTIDIKDLTKWLFEDFVIEIPFGVETVEDMNVAGKSLSKLTNNYAYIEAMSIYAKNAVREEKRKGPENKLCYEYMVDRRDTLQEVAKILNMQYQAISRMITVKQEINKEPGIGLK